MQKFSVFFICVESIIVSLRFYHGDRNWCKIIFLNLTLITQSFLLILQINLWLPEEAIRWRCSIKNYLETFCRIYRKLRLMEYIFIKVPSLVNFLEKMFNVTMPSTLLQKKNGFLKLFRTKRSPTLAFLLIKGLFYLL